MQDAEQELLQHEEHDELWLVSYADLLTLLLGFFVLLIAASPMKLSRFEKMAASISGKSEAPLVDLKEKVDALVAENRLGDRVITREDAEGLGIEFKDALLFDSGSADLRPEALEVMHKVATLVSALPDRPVIIEGHTDDVPVRGGRFRSNWELSSQRAINVLGFLEQTGIPRERLSVKGLADTRPLSVAGTLDAQRAANRRVVIRVE
jgi:chemotaxis protein MotB